jgi:hypothetical protein
VQIDQVLNPPAAIAEADTALTIDEFCFAERFSRSTYFKLQKLGLGPEEFRFPGTKIIRITVAARREWHKRIDKLRNDQTLKRERERRSNTARVAGKIAAASPRHHCRRGRKKSA